MKEDTEEKKFLYGMIASMFCWGISWPVGKILSSYGDAQTIAMLRFLVTFISLLPLLFILKENLSVSRKGIPVLLAASVCMTLYGYLFIEGLHHGKAGAGGVLVTTLNPVLTYLVTMLIALKLPTLKESLGLGVGVIAGAILLQLWDNAGSIFDPGNLYFVSATITWAILSKITSLSSRYGSPASFSLWMYAICTVMMFVFTENETTWNILNQGDSKFWLSLLFSATITTSLATTFYFYATSKIGADKASSYIFMVPLSAAIGSFLILGEVPLWNTLVGGILGIAAVYILQRKKKEKTPQ